MKKIPQQAFTAESEELAVRRVKDGQTIPAVEGELGGSHQTVRNRVKAADAEKLTGAAAGLCRRRVSAQFQAPIGPGRRWSDWSPPISVDTSDANSFQFYSSADHLHRSRRQESL